MAPTKVKNKQLAMTGGHIIQNATTPVTQRTNLDFEAGTGATITFTDSSGSDRTTVTIAISAVGAAAKVFMAINFR